MKETRYGAGSAPERHSSRQRLLSLHSREGLARVQADAAQNHPPATSSPGIEASERSSSSRCCQTLQLILLPVVRLTLSALAVRCFASVSGLELKCSPLFRQV